MSEQIDTATELMFKEWLRQNKIQFVPKLEKQLLFFIQKIAKEFSKEQLLERSMHRLIRSMNTLDEDKDSNTYDIIRSVVDDIGTNLKKNN